MCCGRVRRAHMQVLPCAQAVESCARGCARAGGGTGAPALSALPLALPTVEASGSWDCVAGQSTRATSPGASAHRRAPHASPCRHLPARAVGRGTGPPRMQRVGWGAYVCGSAPGRGRGHVDVHEVGQARLLVIAPLAAGQRSVVQKLHTHRRPAPSQSPVKTLAQGGDLAVSKAYFCTYKDRQKPINSTFALITNRAIN